MAGWAKGVAPAYLASWERDRTQDRSVLSGDTFVQQANVLCTFYLGVYCEYNKLSMSTAYPAPDDPILIQVGKHDRTI